MHPVPKRRKNFNDCSEKYQRVLVNKKLSHELAEELELLKNDEAENKITTRDDEENKCSDVKRTEIEDFHKIENPDKVIEKRGNLNDKPLFGSSLNHNEGINDIDNYLYEKIYDEFCKSYGLDCDKEDDEILFEGKEYSYSDSSDSESDSGSDQEDFDLTEELRVVSRKMTREALTELLKILRNAGHEELPNSAEQLLHTPKMTIITKCEQGEYMHYGLIQCLEDLVKRGVILPARLEIDIGIDGVPISKSTNRKLWPIIARIRNLPRLAPFLVGVYHGFQSPTCSKPFLQPFVDEFKKVENTETIIGLTKHEIFLKYIICDTPGRCMVTDTKSYDGYYGCSRCMVHGDWKKKVVFLQDDAELYTDKSFRERKCPGHHHRTSAFEELNIDMVYSFPLDYMHIICLGVVRLMLMTWFRSKNPLLSAIAIKNLSDDLLSLGKSIPKEFNRKTAGLNELGRWKATVLRHFLLYVGSIVLQGNLPNDVVQHFNLLTCAIRILCHPVEFKRNNRLARELLQEFVNQMKDENFIYGEKCITFNPHSLIHLAQECLHNDGPLDSFCAFEFENFMQFIKKLIKKHEKPLQQLHRRTAEGHYPKKKFRLAEGVKMELRGYIKRESPYRCEKEYRKVVFQDFELTTKPPDNCCVITDGSIILIDGIGTKKGNDYVFGRKFLSTSDFENFPRGESWSISSRDVGMYVVGKLSTDVKSYAVEEIANKCVYFSYRNKSFAIYLLHH